MKKRLILCLTTISFLVLLSAKSVFATVSEDVLAPLHIPAFDADNADWVFSGTVNNEHNETYSFLFHMAKQGHDFTGSAVLVDDKTQTVVISESGHSVLDVLEPMYAQAGHLFLRFDSITRTWMFGLATSEQKGFKFKADVLSLPLTSLLKSQQLKQGVSLQMLQTGAVTGYIQIGQSEETQFVHAHKSLLKQLWLDVSDNHSHLLTSVVCHFRNNSGLYAVRLEEKDAIQGAVAGFRDENDKPLLISQFVNMKKQAAEAWSLQIMPDLVLSLRNIIDKNNMVIAQVTNPLLPGFCVRLEDNVGQLT